MVYLDEAVARATLAPAPAPAAGEGAHADFGSSDRAAERLADGAAGGVRPGTPAQEPDNAQFAPGFFGARRGPPRSPAGRGRPRGATPEIPAQEPDNAQFAPGFSGARR